MAIGINTPVAPLQVNTWQASTPAQKQPVQPTGSVLPGLGLDTYEFHVRDLDHSGTVNSNEFGPGKREQAEFRNRDFDSSGGLDLEEFTAPAWLVAEHMDPQAGFQLLDADKNHALDSEEFGAGAERQDAFQAQDRDDNGLLLPNEYTEGRVWTGN